jgi:hypothetical protein
MKHFALQRAPVTPLGSQEQRRAEEASRKAYRAEADVRRRIVAYTEAHTLCGLQMRAIAWAFNFCNTVAALDRHVAQSLAAVEADRPSSGFELFSFSIARDLIRMAEADPRGPRFPEFPAMPSEEARAERRVPAQEGANVIPFGLGRAEGVVDATLAPSGRDGAAMTIRSSLPSKRIARLMPP